MHLQRLRLDMYLNRKYHEESRKVNKCAQVAIGFHDVMFLLNDNSLKLDIKE